VARRARIGDIGVQGRTIRFGPVRDLRESQQLRLMRLYPGTIVKEALGTILVPAPMTARVGGKPLRDVEVLTWARQLVTAVLLDDIAAGHAVASAGAGAAAGAP
jgi:transcription-repair coupling factor (superfamily II helicase)